MKIHRVPRTDVLEDPVEAEAGRQIIIPEPDNGYRCTMAMLDSPMFNINLDGTPHEVQKRVQAFLEDPEAEALEFWEPGFQKLCLLTRAGAEKITAYIVGWVPQGRGARARKHIEIAQAHDVN